MAIWNGDASKPDLNARYVSEECLVWSHEHRQWWRPNSMGYTADITKAGRYSLQDAQDIVEQATIALDWTKQAPNELVVRIADLPESAKVLLGEM